MKKLLVLSAIGLSSMISFNTVIAADNKTEERIGFGSGLIIGAIAGGPVGAIIGAASGVWLGDKVNEAEKVDPLKQKIAENSIHLTSLRQTIAQQGGELDQAQMLLEQQDVMQQKVAQNKSLMRGLQVDLMFRTNSRELESEAVEKIAPLVLMLDQFPQLELQLTGHGDILGSKDANQQVALERTMAVKQSFVGAGIKADRIHLVNLGRSQADAELDDLDGRALDRRVRIRFMQSETKGSLAFK